jgi:hypothetical protein
MPRGASKRFMLSVIRLNVVRMSVLAPLDAVQTFNQQFVSTVSGATTLSITTFSVTTLSIATLRIVINESRH